MTYTKFIPHLKKNDDASDTVNGPDASFIFYK